MSADNCFRYPDHIRVLGDTAFGTSNRLVRPLSETEIAILPPLLASQAKAIGNFVSSIRIAAEWGVGSITNSFQILRYLPADDPVKRATLWEVAIRLQNLRCRSMGVSETYKYLTGF